VLHKLRLSSESGSHCFGVFPFEFSISRKKASVKSTNTKGQSLG